jgi:hypothetical protein
VAHGVVHAYLYLPRVLLLMLRLFLLVACFWLQLQPVHWAYSGAG